MAGYVTWVAAEDCMPPHGLDMDSAHDREKVEHLAQAFTASGFDDSYPALVGYPLEGKVQLLSGTHRHLAAKLTGTKLPVTLWLGSDVQKSWGLVEEWAKVMRDVPLRDLQEWTREQADHPTNHHCSHRDKDDVRCDKPGCTWVINSVVGVGVECHEHWRRGRNEEPCDEMPGFDALDNF